ncbi:hypothetical protein ACFL6S_28535 [Candidatus Poribacteria bacterium]
MKNWDYNKTWYHGSPYRLTAILKESTITQERDLARVFSHKPSLVSQGDDGRLQHSGYTPGFLYYIGEDIGPDDVYPHPCSSMAEGQEWLTRRELKVTLIGQTQIVENERLTEEQIVEFKKMAAREE